MAALPDLITVAQFRELPERGDVSYELHHGEVVAVTRPRKGHVSLQMRIMRLLDARLQSFGEVVVECPYRPVVEFEFRVADVAAVARERWDAVDPESDLYGAPDLVVEVKSPSNTRTQLQELVTLCLANGAVQCWIVDQSKQSVTVMHRDGSSAVYESGSQIPLAAFGSGPLPVDEIFGAQSF